MKVSFKTLQNQVYELEVPEDINVGELKKLVAEKSGMQHDQINLLYRAVRFADDKKLNEYVKEEG